MSLLDKKSDDIEQIGLVKTCSWEVLVDENGTETKKCNMPVRPIPEIRTYCTKHNWAHIELRLIHRQLMEMQHLAKNKSSILSDETKKDIQPLLDQYSECIKNDTVTYESILNIYQKQEFQKNLQEKLDHENRIIALNEKLKEDPDHIIKKLNTFAQNCQDMLCEMLLNDEDAAVDLCLTCTDKYIVAHTGKKYILSVQEYEE